MEQVIGSVVGGLMGGEDGGSSQTQERQPWAPAQPWLQNNITQGQALQNQYMTNPFSDQQKAAYSNAFGMSDAYRSMLPQLLAGLNSGTFDRRNPLQRPQSFNFGGFSPAKSQLGGFASPQSAAALPVTLPAATQLLSVADNYQSDWGGGRD